MTVFDWDYALAVLPVLLEGLGVTIQATLLGMSLALVLGLILALARLAPYRLVS